MSWEPSARSASISNDDCIKLLGSQRVGRLVFDQSGTHLRPVNYVLVDGDILIRTARRFAEGTPVIFEIDQIEAVDQQGWSVIVTGRAYPALPEAIDPDMREQLAVWAPGVKESWTSIVIDTISGRWVQAERVQPPLDARGYL